MGLQMPAKPNPAPRRAEFHIGAKAWPATLVLGARSRGLVVFADSSMGALRNGCSLYFSKVFQSYGLGTLMCNLLTEQEAREEHQELNVQQFVARLLEVLEWLESQEQLAGLPIGLLGSSTGAASALIVAAHEAERVDAVVSRSGRPDLAQAYLPLVRASTLLIVGSQDHAMVECNRAALDALLCQKRLDIIPNASHQFKEPGALDVAAGLAGHWFEQHLTESGVHGHAP